MFQTYVLCMFFTGNRYCNKYISVISHCTGLMHCSSDDGKLYIQGLSGQPLTGPDIGGFAGNATPRMFGRWMGIGSLFPFCRAHSEADTNDHEPWSFGEEVHFFSLIMSSQTILQVPFSQMTYFCVISRGSV